MADTDKWDQEEDEAAAGLALWLCPICAVFICGKTGLAASAGAACTSGIPEPSHVLRAMGLSENEADSSIRFSFGRFTTEGEVHEAAGLVARVLRVLGSV